MIWSLKILRDQTTEITKSKSKFSIVFYDKIKSKWKKLWLPVDEFNRLRLEHIRSYMYHINSDE